MFRGQHPDRISEAYTALGPVMRQPVNIND